MRWAVSLMKGARVSMAWSASRAGRPPWRLAWATVSARGVSRLMVGSPLGRAYACAEGLRGGAWGSDGDCQKIFFGAFRRGAAQAQRSQRRRAKGGVLVGMRAVRG